MIFTSLKIKIVSFIDKAVNRFRTIVASSASSSFFTALPTACTAIYEILEVLYDPYDALADQLGFTMLEEFDPDPPQVGYFSNAQFVTLQEAKDAMQFDLASAMTTTMPGLYQDSHNVYGIMSDAQQEKIDRQDYEFIEYSQEILDVRTRFTNNQAPLPTAVPPFRCKVKKCI